MATTPTLAASSQTKSNNQAGSTAVSVIPPRKITYVFSATSSSNLSIPYAIAVDGKALPAYARKPARVSGASGKFTVTVQQGQSVSFYLNSDAHPEFRGQPVYLVTAGERDAVVRIKEKSGKSTEADTPVKLVDADAKREAAKTADDYSAPLTGDIWMKVSHKYTEAEALARMPAGTSAAVQGAVKSIYGGLASATLTVTEPATAGQPARTLKVTFTDSDNPKNNISSYALLTDGLPRVHPAGYAALLTAALDNSIASMTVSSCWRPMLGIAHRAGLGLDVSVIGGTPLNRQELRKAFEGKTPSKTGNGKDNDNVTDAEVLAFGKYEAAIKAKKTADATFDTANRALSAAKKGTDAQQVASAEAQLETARDTAKEAAETETMTRDAWDAERIAGEADRTRLFRTSLLKCSCVRQLFDPWFMEDSTKDNRQPVANMQRGASTSNERLHSHHLHITVDDTKIL